MKTRDLWLAAFLTTRGYEIIKFDCTNPNAIKFIFEPEAKKDAEEYWNGTTVVALRYAVALKELKQRMFMEIKRARENGS